MSEIALVQVTCPGTESARGIGEALLVERLIACANVWAAGPSVYRWQGRVEHAEEALLQMKTLPEHAEAVAARLAELHPYDLPAIERWTVRTDAATRDWVASGIEQVS